MTDTRAEDALRQQASMEAERSVMDSHCQEVAERVLTRQRDFNGSKRQQGQKADEKVFDSTAPLALGKFSAAIDGMLTPRSSQWHGLALSDEFGEQAEIKRMLEQATKTLFRYRYRPAANFAGQIHETWNGIGAFGNGAVFVDDEIGRGPIYRSIAFAEMFWAENFQGRIDTVHRKFELTARQMKQQFVEDDLPETIRKAAETEPYRKFEVLHCVRPREDASWSRADYRGMKFASYYISFEGRKLLRESGYRTMRYGVGRYVTAPKEVYGRGPAMQVLADIKSANEMQKTLLRTGQLAAEPPLLISDDAGIGGLRMQPRALIRGGLDMEGRALVQPLLVGANLPITLEVINQTRGVINDGFLVTLFQILVEEPQMTATQAMLRAQEKGMLLAPTGGRLQSELLETMIQAEIDILSQYGEFDEFPEEFFDRDDILRIEHTSPMSRAMMAEEGIGIMRTVEAAGPIMEIDPEAGAVFSGKGAQIIRRLGEINGMSAMLLNTPDEVDGINAQRGQKQNIADVLGAAESASGSAANFAKAQSLISASPGTAAPQLFEAA